MTRPTWKYNGGSVKLEVESADRFHGDWYKLLVHGGLWFWSEHTIIHGNTSRPKYITLQCIQPRASSQRRPHSLPIMQYFHWDIFTLVHTVLYLRANLERKLYKLSQRNSQATCIGLCYSRYGQNPEIVKTQSVSIQSSTQSYLVDTNNSWNNLNTNKNQKHDAIWQSPQSHNHHTMPVV